MPIPDGSTPIKHEILTDIFAKGLLSYPEMRIVCQIIRLSWGYDDKKNHRRQDWTNPLTIAELSKQIGMSYAEVHRNMKTMTGSHILLKDGDKYQFNEHYEQYDRKSYMTGSHKTMTGSHITMTENHTNMTGSHIDDMPETPMETESEGKNPHHKDTLKILNTKISSKDTYTRILIFWNSLKIIEHKDTDKLRRKIIAAFKIYTPEELEDAMKNYAYILNNPDKFYWTYKWQLRDFLDRGVERFLPVNFKERDFLKRVYKSKAELDEERSLGILSRVFREEEEKENDKKGNDSNPGSPEGSI
jgi:AraC-like DNA-binding protein